MRITFRLAAMLTALLASAPAGAGSAGAAGARAADVADPSSAGGTVTERAATLAGRAGTATSDCLPRIEQAWLRLPPAAMPMLAGFARIANSCSTDITIVSVSSDAFASVELHQSRIVDGVSRMRPVPALRVPAGGAVELAPGGLHLMLMQPAAPLDPGARVALRMRLDDGREVEAAFALRGATTP